MSRRRAALLILLAAAAIAPAAPSGPQRPIERTPEFVGRVNSAVDRGVAWLRKEQKDDGSVPEFPMFPGATTALTYITLRACDVPATDRSAKNAWAALKRAYRRQDLSTYSAALYLMAIAEHGERAKNAQDERDVKLAKDDAKWAAEIVQFLVAVQDPMGRFNYEGSASTAVRSEPLPVTWDNSNTQYALLGLKSAARCGIAIDPAVWRRSLAHFVNTQEPDGPEVVRGTGAVKRGSTSAPMKDRARGWTYRNFPGATTGSGASEPGRPAYTAMTAGGVSSLVICRSELIGTGDMTPKLDADSERAAWDGLAWMGTNWQPNASLTPPEGLDPRIREAMGSGISPYEFYGVERAGALAGVEWMGEKDWYGDGAASLVARQLADGSWTGIDAGLMMDDLAGRKRAFRGIDTCFALLFLRRGTTPVTRGAVTSGGNDSEINFDAAAALAGKDLEDFLDLVTGRWRRTDDADVKERLFDGATTAGPRILEPLLLRMESPDAVRRASAHALLSHATGLDFGYADDAPPDRREDALVKWQMWWMESKDRLAYDATTRKIARR